MNRLRIFTIAIAAFAALAAGARAAGGADIPPEIRVNGVAVIDVYASTQAGRAGDRQVRFSSADGDLAARLWDEYAPVFGGTGWDNADPELRHEVIILSKDGKSLVLRSRHRITETDPDLVVTANAVKRLGGRDRGAVLRAGPPEYLARREAFEKLMQECGTPAKVSPAAAPAAPPAPPARETPKAQPAPSRRQEAVTYQIGPDYPARIKKQQELLRKHERERMLRNLASAVQSTIYLLPVSFPWVLPLLILRKKARNAGLTSPWWLLAALALSPLGWASALSVTNISKALIFFSILAPAACALLLKFFHRDSGTARKGLSEWGISAALLFYGSWSATGAAQFYTASMSAGSSERAAIGQLSAMRSHIQVYHGDKEAREFPAGLHELIPRYAERIPAVNSQSRASILHGASDRITYFSSRDYANDKGGWGYVNEPTLPDGTPNREYGDIFINCTHKDLRDSKRLCDY